MIANGFIEPFTKELSIEYAVVLKRLMQLEMAGSVG
jgi:Fe-S cluster assembly scaffold protein SufB